RQDGAIDQPNAETAENDRAHPRRMLHRQERSDARAHRIAQHVGALDLDMIEQRPHVLRHDCAVISRRIVRLARCPMPTIVERDHAPSGARQRRHPAGRNPIYFLGGSKTMHQHDRLAFAFVEVGDLDIAMTKEWHNGSNVPECTPMTLARARSPNCKIFRRMLGTGDAGYSAMMSGLAALCMATLG